MLRRKEIKGEGTYWNHSQDDYSSALHDSVLQVWFLTLSSCADRLLRRQKPGQRKKFHSCSCVVVFFVIGSCECFGIELLFLLWSFRFGEVTVLCLDEEER